jgi:hypothetical protein
MKPGIASRGDNTEKTLKRVAGAGTENQFQANL